VACRGPQAEGPVDVQPRPRPGRGVGDVVKVVEGAGVDLTGAETGCPLAKVSRNVTFIVRSDFARVAPGVGQEAAEAVDDRVGDSRWCGLAVPGHIARSGAGGCEFYRGRFAVAAVRLSDGPPEVVDTLLAWPRHTDWI
jgi:hypothetical protein